MSIRTAEPQIAVVETHIGRRNEGFAAGVELGSFHTVAAAADILDTVDRIVVVVDSPAVGRNYLAEGNIPEMRMKYSKALHMEGYYRVEVDKTLLLSAWYSQYFCRIVQCQ